MAWQFGDSFDHYLDPAAKYDAVGTAQAIGIGTGRFGTNSIRFTGAGGFLRKDLTGALDAFATLAATITRTTPGRFGFLNLWSGTRGHVVLAREDDGSITARRQTGNEAPLDSSGPIIGTTAAGVWPVGLYTSIEVGIQLSPTTAAGALRMRVNGAELVTLYNVITANPNAGGWSGWYVGLEKSIGVLDVDDLMFYTDQNIGDGVQDFLGDLTGEVLTPRADYSAGWTRNGGASNAAAVAEIPPDGDLSYVESGIVGQLDWYTVTKLQRVSQGIRCVQAVITARKTGSPSRTMTGIMYDWSGPGEFIGPTIALTVPYHMAVMPQPIAAWGGYWTMDQVNAMLVGVQLTG